jgi:hypothetical protein
LQMLGSPTANLTYIFVLLPHEIQTKDAITS